MSYPSEVVFWHLMYSGTFDGITQLLSWSLHACATTSCIGCVWSESTPHILATCHVSKQELPLWWTEARICLFQFTSSLLKGLATKENWQLIFFRNLRKVSELTRVSLLPSQRLPPWTCIQFQLITTHMLIVIGTKDWAGQVKKERSMTQSCCWQSYYRDITQAPIIQSTAKGPESYTKSQEKRQHALCLRPSVH